MVVSARPARAVALQRTHARAPNAARSNEQWEGGGGGGGGVPKS